MPGSKGRDSQKKKGLCELLWHNVMMVTSWSTCNETHKIRQSEEERAQGFGFIDDGEETKGIAIREDYYWCTDMLT